MPTGENQPNREAGMQMITKTIDTNQGTLTIRQAVLSDAIALRELRLEGLKLNPEAFGSDYEREVNQPVSKWEERLSAQVNSALFVAEGSSGLLGMTGIGRSELVKAKHNGTVYGVYVRPVWRNLGLGVHLVEASLAWARKSGLKLVKLGVITTNTAAIRAYQKIGFHVYGVDEAVLFQAGVYYDELLMAFRL
jgi:ribosomal protein S18 acetylase RimI-like enzyme